MPRIPDFTALGRATEPTVFPVSKPEAAYGNARETIINAAQKSGTGLQRIGQGLSHLADAGGNYLVHAEVQAKEEKAKQDEIALNDAQNSWLLSKANLRESLRNENDPAQIGKTYFDAYETASKTAKQYLNDEQAARFDKWLTPDVIEQKSLVSRRINDLEKDIGKARSIENIDRFKNIAVRGRTAGEAMAQVPAIGREIENGVLKGYWSASVAVEQKNAATRNVATDWLKAQPDETQIAILGGWTHSLMAQESGGNPARVNPYGYAGLYQFGAPRLAYMGVYTPGANENLKNWSGSSKAATGKWSGTFNIPGHPEIRTIRDFLTSPEAQEATFGVHFAKMDQEIKDNGLEKYIGKTVGGVPITREGVYAMMHLGGAGGAKAALEGKGNPADANGTTVLQYAKHGLAADRRIAELVPADDKASMLHGALQRRQAEIAHVDAVLNEQIATQAAVEKVNAGTGINPFDPDGKKDLSRAYSGLVAGGMQPNDALVHIVDQTKAIPPDAMQGIRQGMASDDPNTVAGTATLALNLMSRGGNAVFKPYNGDKIAIEATKFEHYSDYMSPSDAAKRIITERDPSYQAKVKAQRDTNGVEKSLRKDEENGALLTDIAKQYGAPRLGGWLGTERAQVAFREGDRQQLVEDYKDLVRKHYDETSDYALSRRLAQKDLNNVWGQSNVTGSPVAMRYPPENAPALMDIPNVSDGIAKQIQDEIKAERGTDVDRSKIILDPVEDGVTMRAFQSGNPPPYRVSWIDKDGHLQMLNPGFAFVPDIEKLHKATEEQFRRKQALLSETPPESATIGDISANPPESVVR